MKNKLFKFNCIIFLLFILFIIYENIMMLYLINTKELKLIYTSHYEIFYNRIIYYELEVTSFTNFTFKSFLKVLFNFIQSIGIFEILYILFSIPIYLNEEKDNRLTKHYINIYSVFGVKFLVTVICLLLGYLTYSIELSIAWLIINIVLILSIIYYTYIVIRVLRYLKN
jgi:hypothetical protein